MRSLRAWAGWQVVLVLLMVAVAGCHSNQPGAVSTSATTTPPPPDYLSTLHCVEEYNRTNPGTWEAMNNNTDHYGGRYRFFASDGKPDIGVIDKDFSSFDDAFEHVIPVDFREQCLKAQRALGFY